MARIGCLTCTSSLPSWAQAGRRCHIRRRSPTPPPPRDVLYAPPPRPAYSGVYGCGLRTGRPPPGRSRGVRVRPPRTGGPPMGGGVRGDFSGSDWAVASPPPIYT
eukprot:scaffold17876_cov132-Isochrysis_galbana.AAC.7